MKLTNAITSGRKSLMNSADASFFKPFLDHYDVTHESLMQQSLDDLIKCCRSTISSIISNHASLSATYHSNLAAPSKPALQPRPRKATSNPRLPTDSPTEFCWTHGHGFHSSMKCRNPAAGHQNAATKSNKMGSDK